MPRIELSHISKRWDKFYAVDDLNLVIEDNAFVTLLGPSGCGKTTTLRMIADSRAQMREKYTLAMSRSTSLHQISVTQPWYSRAMLFFLTIISSITLLMA